ncbi:helix-turn-helix domain-containing protein [uncultured Alistipes sp.]|jgi:DNA binding domain protein|uniref:helix-turn-helix domain-containing protein n=1 Tax=uncultured Alistipes sp. TaxID=538949 RepID=UPI0025FB4B21|nr:helix-turn-helix domain-containing protein [uncultured Alistipes sp.]
MEPIRKDTNEFASMIKKITQASDSLNVISEQYRPSIENERYYTGEEVQKVLHLSKRTLQNYRDDGIMPYTKIGEKILYRHSDIIQILEANYVPGIDY